MATVAATSILPSVRYSSWPALSHETALYQVYEYFVVYDRSPSPVCSTEVPMINAMILEHVVSLVVLMSVLFSFGPHFSILLLLFWAQLIWRIFSLCVDNCTFFCCFHFHCGCSDLHHEWFFVETPSTAVSGNASLNASPVLLPVLHWVGFKSFRTSFSLSPYFSFPVRFRYRLDCCPVLPVTILLWTTSVSLFRTRRVLSSWWRSSVNWSCHICATQGF